MNKHELANLLNALSNTISSMNDADYSLLLQGKGKLIYQSPASNANQSSKQTPPSVQLPKPTPTHSTSTPTTKPDEKINQALNTIRHATSRGELEAYFKHTKFLKDELISLTDHLDIYINKRSRKAQIIESIIDSTIGVKLRSKAIEETDLN